MKRRRRIFAPLTLTLIAPLLGDAQAQSLTTYVESSGSEQTPRSNAGLSVQSDWLRMQAGLALRGAHTEAATPTLQQRPAGRTEVVPNLRSAVTIAANLDLETRVSFAEWNAGSGTTVDTRLRYRKALDGLFEEVDASVWRLATGSTKQTWRLRFRENVRDAGPLPALTVAGEAIFESTHGNALALPGASVDTRKIGAETRLAGLVSPFAATHNTLSLKLEKTVGARTESASSVAYDQSWVLGPLTTFGLNLSFLRRTHSLAEDFEPSVNFTWRSEL